MRHNARFLRQLTFTLVAVGSCVLQLLTTSSPGWTDDRDLLRFNTSKPYLFLLLDTSSSMALKLGPGDVWVPGGADNPASRIFQAKQAVHDVFKTASDLHFGFASYNQDRVRAVLKHWLYFTSTPPVITQGTWPITFPRPELDGDLTKFIDTPINDTDGDGIPDQGDGIPEPIEDIVSGDVLTLGPHYPIGTVGRAGSCDSPLDLATVLGRNRARSFAIQAEPTNPTRLWVREGGQTYLMEVSKLNPADVIGTDSPIVLHFHLTPATCTGAVGQTNMANFTFRMDPFLNQILAVDKIPTGNRATREAFGRLWDWSDVESRADFSSDHPFTGKGWEGNYDSGFTTGNNQFDNKVTEDDHYCRASQDPFDCERGPKPVSNTTMGRDPLTLLHEPALDSGDMIPFNWQTENRDRFLQRLAPNLVSDPALTPNFGVASYFADRPTLIGSGPDALYPLVSPTQRPLAAADVSPLAKAINDFRCWYLGKEGRGAAGKCGQTAFFDLGWESMACQFDSEFGCRRPFLIIISDGEETEGGEDATADVASLKAQSGIQTWAINLGDPDRCDSGGGLHPIVRSGGGECLTVSNRQELMETLRDILGEIRETARSFASAAVPSVQATVEQKIFLTSFTPLNEESVWDGHIFSFLKPLPLDDGRPNRDARCDGSGTVPQRDTECLLWDAGEVMLTQVTDPPLDLADPGARRVFYSQVRQLGDWPNGRQLLEPIDCSADPPSQRCLDLLDGLGILPDPVPADLSVPQDRANSVITRTLALKTATVDEVDPITGDTISRDIEYILGDTFHSTPLVVGTPPNTSYFASDLFVEEGDPAASCDSDDAKGYRCFFRRHQNRRRVLLVGSDDGMLHAFDSGNFRTSGNDAITNKPLDNEFDNGLGKEIFAYVSRTVMPRVRQLAEGTDHQFTVDGVVAAGDVFIDPVFTPAIGPDPAQRQWRTVAVTGLREGGSGYFALDVTQPDHIDFQNDIFEPDDRGNYIPSCTTDYNANDCGPVPYPSPLWEFTDSVFDAVNGYVRLDEDANLEADLGDTWSTANIGLLEVCAVGGTACKPKDPDPANRADVERRFVAVFGGGMDVDSKTLSADPLDDLTPAGSAQRGNWVYMVDVETGQVLYKRQVVGAVPSEIAAVDTDQDGALDRLYFGTIAGLVYRVDLTPDSNGDLPALDDTFGPVLGMDGAMHDVGPRVTDSDWEPRVLFDTLGDTSAASSTDTRRPVYQRPSVFFVAKLGLYGLSLGSGDREDLWSVSPAEGRFWVFVDDTGPLTPALNENPLERIDLIEGDTATDFLLDPARAPGTRGWYLALGVNERVITDAFALSGITIFSSFLPRTEITDDDGNPVDAGCSDQGRGDPGERRCSKVGNSNIFAVNTTNANALLQDTSGVKVRSVVTPTYVSNPFAETGTTRDVGSGSDGQTADDLDQRLIDIMESLKSLFPTNCKFANYRIDVKTVASDTSLNFIAPIPVCLVEKNWKEF